MTAPPDRADPGAQRQLWRSRGDATVGLVIPPRQPDRLAALLTFTGADGRQYQVELTRRELGRLAGDITRLLAADADEACGWWYRLSRSDAS